MPYDPTKPQANTPLNSAEMREQLQGIVTLLGDYATAADVNNAILSGAAGNCDAVGSLGLGVSNPPTQAEMQAIADKLDELIAVLKRV